MKMSFVVGVSAVILFGGVAVAQPAPPPGGPRQPGPAGAEAPPPPPPGAGPRREAFPPPPPPKGAHFMLRQDDSIVDVKCAEDEPMKACADLALQMADRVFSPPKGPAAPPPKP